jgi:hypothetical protein
MLAFQRIGRKSGEPLAPAGDAPESPRKFSVNNLRELRPP